MKIKGIIECPVCKKLFLSLGYARHRAMHYDKRQREKLKVFCCNADGVNTLFSATKTKAEFLRLTGISDYHFSQHGHETGNKEDCSACLLNPGTVLFRNNREMVCAELKKWVKK